MKTILFALTILISFSSASYANGLSLFQTTPLYKKLEETNQTSGAVGVNAILREDIKTGEDVLVSAEWLRDNSILYTPFGKDIHKYTPIYTLIYSDLMRKIATDYLKAGIKEEFISYGETSLMALYTFEAIATADALRCKDLSVPSTVPRLIAPRYQSLETLIASLSADRMATIWDNALSQVKAVSNRPPNKELCSGGMAGIQAALKNSNTKTLSQNDPNFVGGHVQVIQTAKDYSYQPEYISDAEWAQKVKEIPNFKDIWTLRYKGKPPQK